DYYCGAWDGSLYAYLF
nr:immunoglobulin light chain junction region [Macaca mulatta]MOV98264.1 immunoglobulin light chain junction region [Macaca mulatta]